MVNTLEIDSVQKSFGYKSILTDVYLKCQTGDIIGLLGRNGTGKSTLMKIVFGTMPTVEKFVAINGQKHDQLFKIPGAVAYLPQHNFLVKNITVNKAANLFIKDDLIADFFNDHILYSLRKNKVNQLSGGELRYLEVMLLLYSDNKFVLLDEPFNGIAPVIIDELKKMIQMQSAKKGIILTDHDYNNVLDVATRFCILFDGGIKSIGSKDDLVKYGYLTRSL